MPHEFTLFAIVQNGRLAYEALLLAASLRATNPDQQLTLMEPQPGPLWPDDPRINDDLRAELIHMGAKILPFENHHFGASYPNGNKIEALAALPDQPFVFVDTDTLITGPLADVKFDFTRPSASLKRTETWPKITDMTPTRREIWKSLYDQFGLDFEASLDPNYPPEDWQHYLYFNAGFFCGASPQAFGRSFTDMALAIRDTPPPELDGQKLDPWLDQITLPLVIHILGGGRETLPAGLIDGKTTCHYRTLPLLYARETDSTVKFLEEIAAPNPIKKLLKQHKPAHKMIYQGQGAELRSKYFTQNLEEPALRKALKADGYWLR